MSQHFEILVSATSVGTIDILGNVRDNLIAATTTAIPSSTDAMAIGTDPATALPICGGTYPFVAVMAPELVSDSEYGVRSIN